MYVIHSLQVVAELTLQLSTSTKLPLDCREMSKTLQEERDALKSSLNNRQLNTDKHITLGKLQLLDSIIKIISMSNFKVCIKRQNAHVKIVG